MTLKSFGNACALWRHRQRRGALTTVGQYQAGTGKHPHVLATMLALALTVLATATAAQQQDSAAVAATDDPIEAGAVAALEQMGAYLRTLKTFQVEAATTREDVLDDGEKIQSAGVTNLIARSPDRLRVEVANDDQQRFYLFDGKTFTLFAQRLNYYATVPAPPTIAELAGRLEDKYGMDLPLADLFRWGAPDWEAVDLKAATDVGPSPVGGASCEHYAFRQEGLDWQVWIQQGDYPLPRKLVITTLTDEARPQYTATYTWNLAPAINDAAFSFDPPSGAQRIVFAETPLADDPSNQ